MDEKHVADVVSETIWFSSLSCLTGFRSYQLGCSTFHRKELDEKHWLDAVHPIVVSAIEPIGSSHVVWVRPIQELLNEDGSGSIRFYYPASPGPYILCSICTNKVPLVRSLDFGG